MGWNNLEIKKPGIILEDVADDSWVYFVHSYRAKPTFDDVITAESDYGVKVPAVVEKNNFFGTQFHPEKSGDVGKIMIQNFLNVCKK
jgi:glutamine amidotransferase